MVIFKKSFIFIFYLPLIFSLNPNIKTSKTKIVNTKIPDIYKRHLMNNILLTSIGSSCGPLLFGYLNFFYPKSNNNNEDGVLCKDRMGKEVYEDEWINNNPFPNRNLVEGLKGDPYYIITTSDSKLEKFAINAICTHLGCVVPWNKAENKFMCPCHGSQYDYQGKVIRGPAPKSLSLGKLNTNNNQVFISPWNEKDFRTDEQPWWI